MLRRRGFVPVLAIMACAQPTLAAQLAVDFQARVTIQTSCTVTASQLNFGSVGTISFSPLASVTNYNGSMINGAGSVAYSANLSAAGGIGPGIHTIDGVLSLQATPAPAIYTDNRTVYLNY